jgi:uncharacterized membrane protein YjfL (UPF0719 family)
MWKLVGNVIEMFVYSAVYMIIVLVAVKIVGSVFSTDFEKKISDEGNIALAIICGCIFIGTALLLASAIR